MAKEYPAASDWSDGPCRANAQGPTILNEVSYVANSGTTHVNSASSRPARPCLQPLYHRIRVQRSPKTTKELWGESDWSDVHHRTNAQDATIAVIVKLGLAIGLTLCRSNTLSVRVWRLLEVHTNPFSGTCHSCKSTYRMVQGTDPSCLDLYHNTN